MLLWMVDASVCTNWQKELKNQILGVCIPYLLSYNCTLYSLFSTDKKSQLMKSKEILWDNWKINLKTYKSMSTLDFRNILFYYWSSESVKPIHYLKITLFISIYHIIFLFRCMKLYYTYFFLYSLPIFITFYFPSKKRIGKPFNNSDNQNFILWIWRKKS